MTMTGRYKAIVATGVVALGVLAPASPASAAAPRLVDLGPGDALALNDHDVVVGYSRDGEPPYATHAVKWDRDGHGARLALPPGGDISSTAVAVNDAGLIAGNQGMPPYSRAVRWDAGGNPALLESSWRSSEAIAMNEHGVVVGIDGDGTGTNVAVRWDTGGHRTELPTLPPYASCAPKAINDDGTAAGTCYTGIPGGMLETRAARWDRDGHVVELGPLPGGRSSSAVGIDDRGVVVGQAVGADGVYRAVRWDRDGRIEELGVGAELQISEAVAVNGRGTAVGNALPVDGAYRGVRWDRHGRPTLLEATAGSMRAVAVNEHGAVVGLVVGAGFQHALRWDRAGRVTDLGALPGSTVSGARRVNGGGTVIGWGFGPGDVGQTRALMWLG